MSGDTTPAFLKGNAFRDRKFAFRIDEEKAFAKLRDYRVAEPERYVLELILCAITSGATRIDITPGVWAVRLSWDGEPFTRDELDGLYHHLIEEGEGGSTRLSHLASAMVMVSHLAPRKVTIRSGGVALTETWPKPDEPKRVLTDSAAAADSLTHVEVALRRRFEPLQLMGFRDTSEEAVVRARVLRPTATVTIDGKPLLVDDLPHIASTPVDSDGVTGTLGLADDYNVNLPLKVCYRGILIQERTYAGVGGVLSSSALKRNISLNDVLDDAAYKSLLMCARRARRPLEHQLAAHRLDQIGAEAATKDELIHRLMSRLLPFAGLKADDPLRMRLEALPVLRTVHGAPTSFADVVSEFRTKHPGEWPYAKHKRWRGEPALFCAVRTLAAAERTPGPLQLDGQTVVVVPLAGGPFKRLKSLVDACFVDRTQDVQRHKARGVFMEQAPIRAELTDEADIVVPVRGAGIWGQLGMHPSRRTGNVRILFGRRPIARLHKGVWQGVFGVINVTKLTPKTNYKGFVDDEDFEPVRTAIAKAQEALVDVIIERLASDELVLSADRRWLRWLFDALEHSPEK
ncbi:MAG: hypothetical protein ACI9OJ_002592, partial [Myxococcota bacterium]